MTSPSASSRPDLIAAFGFERQAKILEARAERHRRMGGNWLMYGEAEAAQDIAAANAIRSVAMLIDAALASEPEPQPVAGDPEHVSDCRLHDGPALMPGNCSCGADPSMTPERYGSERPSDE